jgi:hypothetical protein
MERKKRFWRQVCEWLSAAVAFLPTAVSLLALFMQISGVSLTLPWPCRLCLLRVLLCMSQCYKLFPFQALGEVTLHPLSQACMFIYVGSGSSPLFCGFFLPLPLLQAFPLLFARHVLLLLPASVLVYSSHERWVFSPSPVEFYSLCHSHKLSCSWLLGTCPRSRQSLSGQTRLVYLQFQEGFPSLPLWHSGHPTLFAMCLYCSYCLLLSFCFFPGWGLVCPGDFADLAQGCLCEYHVPLSSPCLHLPKPSGHGRLAARGPSWFLHLT